MAGFGGTASPIEAVGRHCMSQAGAVRSSFRTGRDLGAGQDGEAGRQAVEPAGPSRELPEGWARLRVLGYLYWYWAWFVVLAIGPANQGRWDALQRRFETTIHSAGDPFRAVPESAAERGRLLADYDTLIGDGR